MHPKHLSDEELLNAVLNHPAATEVEKVLAARLSMALDYIEQVEEALEENGLLGVEVPIQ
jgi:hypothetical protein